MSILPQGFTIWISGLPSSGKTTLAYRLHKAMENAKLPSAILDGDEIRRHLNKGLGYTKKDRLENINRIIFVANLLNSVGGISIVGAITPYQEMRDLIRTHINRLVEVYLHCPVEVCMQRDVKGLYRLAAKGEIQNFTGVSDPYEIPSNPDVIANTDKATPEECVQQILSRLVALGYMLPNIPQES